MIFFNALFKFSGFVDKLVSPLIMFEMKMGA